MRFHTLQSVWSADASALTRHLFEGGRLDLDQMGPTALDSGECFCSDEWLNSRLVVLHRMARLGCGQNIQAHIDSYIPAVAFLCGRERRCADEGAFARRMVLCISDAPQEGTLPDLGFKLRSALLAFRPHGPRGGKNAHQASICDFPGVLVDDCYATRMLLQALPCIKKGVRKEVGNFTGYQVGLNVLLGLLLGLYPSAVKFPPFQVRVTVYTRIHQLLTMGGGKEFCECHPMLMTMAFMEYCAHVVPSYLSAEHEILVRETGMASFFSSVPVACDVFRQDMLNNMGSECDIPWASLERYCEAVVDKYTRGCKNRVKQKRNDHGVCSRIPLDVVQTFASLPLVTPYDVHLDEGTHRILGSELATFDLDASESRDLARQPNVRDCTGRKSLEPDTGDLALRRKRYEMVAAMQVILRVSSLPANIIRKQLRSLAVCMGVCERSALDGMILYVCASCGLGSSGASRSLQTRGQCRLDGRCFSMDGHSARFVCSHCQASAVIAVNTLGRVVTLRSQCFFLAPCCCTVQVYGGSGGEFQSEYCAGSEEVLCEQMSSGVIQHACPHRRRKSNARPQRARCEVCQTVSSGAVAPELFTVVDHLTGVMRSIRLCSRHAPRPEALKHVVNWSQLMSEVNKRDKPLFALNAK